MGDGGGERQFVRKRQAKDTQEQARTKVMREMRKPAKTVRCALLNGTRSTWRDRWAQDMKQGRGFEADAERITDVNASSKDCKRKSGGVFAAVGSDTRVVVDRHGRMSEDAGLLLAIRRMDTEK